MDLLVTINCIDSDVSASVTSKLNSLNSLTEEDELKIATEAKIEGAMSAIGYLKETKILEWEKGETSSPPPAYDWPLLDCDAIRPLDRASSSADDETHCRPSPHFVISK